MDKDVEMMWTYFLRLRKSVKEIRRCNVDDGALLHAAAVLTAGKMSVPKSKPSAVSV